MNSSTYVSSFRWGECRVRGQKNGKLFFGRPLGDIDCFATEISWNIHSLAIRT